jgi:hypothetical protein
MIPNYPIMPQPSADFKYPGAFSKNAFDKNAAFGYTSAELNR